MPLTFEQFQELRQKGLSIEQIASFEAGFKPKQQNILQKIGGFLGNITGATGTIKGIKGAVDIARGKPTQAPTPKQFLGSAGKLGLTATTFGTGGLAAGVRGGLGVVTRAGESGIIGATFQALQNLEKQKPIEKGIGTATAIGGAIPIGGAVLRGAKKLIGKGALATGQKIQTTLIKPSQADIKDGFNTSNLEKYKIGGSLSDMFEQTQNKMNSLTNELYQKIKGSKATININEILKETQKRISKEKFANFGELGSTNRAFDRLKEELNLLLKNNKNVNLAEAQSIKQGAGKKGAWVFGNPDPDARGTEKVFTAFYRTMRGQIENKGESGIREINKQLQELIPISHAIIRRIPVAEKNNILSLTDIIAGGFGLIEPKAFAFLGIKKLLQAPRVGAGLVRIGRRLQQAKVPKTPIGQRIFGK